MRARFCQIVFALLVCSLATGAATEAKGFFGFGLAIDGSGMFFNPTLRSVLIKKVIPKTPAAKAGIAVGDKIIAAEGRPIAGSKARDLQPYLQKRVGQSLHLRLQRSAGTEYEVTLVAIPKTPGM